MNMTLFQNFIEKIKDLGSRVQNAADLIQGLVQLDNAQDKIQANIQIDIPEIIQVLPVKKVIFTEEIDEFETEANEEIESNEFRRIELSVIEHKQNQPESIAKNTELDFGKTKEIEDSINGLEIDNTDEVNALSYDFHVNHPIQIIAKAAFVFSTNIADKAKSMIKKALEVVFDDTDEEDISEDEYLSQDEEDVDLDPNFSDLEIDDKESDDNSQQDDSNENFTNIQKNEALSDNEPEIEKNNFQEEATIQNNIMQSDERGNEQHNSDTNNSVNEHFSNFRKILDSLWNGKTTLHLPKEEVEIDFNKKSLEKDNIENRIEQIEQNQNNPQKTNASEEGILSTITNSITSIFSNASKIYTLTNTTNNDTDDANTNINDESALLNTQEKSSENNDKNDKDKSPNDLLNQDEELKEVSYNLSSEEKYFSFESSDEENINDVDNAVNAAVNTSDLAQDSELEFFDDGYHFTAIDLNDVIDNNIIIPNGKDENNKIEKETNTDFDDILGNITPMEAKDTDTTDFDDILGNITPKETTPTEKNIEEKDTDTDTDSEIDDILGKITPKETNSDTSIASTNNSNKGSWADSIIKWTLNEDQIEEMRKDVGLNATPLESDNNSNKSSWADSIIKWALNGAFNEDQIEQMKKDVGLNSTPLESDENESSDSEEDDNHVSEESNDGITVDIQTETVTSPLPTTLLETHVEAAAPPPAFCNIL